MKCNSAHDFPDHNVHRPLIREFFLKGRKGFFWVGLILSMIFFILIRYYPEGDKIMSYLFLPKLIIEGVRVYLIVGLFTMFLEPFAVLLKKMIQLLFLDIQMTSNKPYISNNIKVKGCVRLFKCCQYKSFEMKSLL